MFKICPKCHKTVMKRARECIHCGHIFSELSDLSVNEDIMEGVNDSEAVNDNATHEKPSEFQRMKVAYWYWKVVYRKKDRMPMIRVDFYGEDKLQGPKQLFLYIMQEDGARERAYRQIKSLLQGVKIPELEKFDNVKILYELCETVRDNFTPPSWIEYKEENQDGHVHYTIPKWGWDE